MHWQRLGETPLASYCRRRRKKMKNTRTLAITAIAVLVFVSVAGSQQSTEIYLNEAIVTTGENLPIIPQANTVKLSATANVLSKSGCPMTAWVGFINTQGQKYPLKNYMVNFVKVSGSGTAPASGVTNVKGELRRVVPSNTVVRATVQSYQLLTSNDYKCGEQNPKTL